MLSPTLLRTSCALLALAAVTVSYSQTLNEYLSLRKKHGIKQAVGSVALDSFLGSRVMEIKGVVRGTIGISGITVLLVERPDGGHFEVESKSSTDWLSGNSVRARLLVQANRATEAAPFSAKLIGAAPEFEISKLEAKEKAVADAKAHRISSSQQQVFRAPANVQNWSLPASDVTPIYAQFIRKYNKRLTQAQANEIATGIVGYSIKFGVDARLIMAMVLVESGFDPTTTSHAGAQGLGQLMPGTAREMGVSNAYDTMQNLRGTVNLVRNHIDKYQARTEDDYEALVLALAAYNAGPGAVKRHGGVPPFRETQNYVRKVIAVYKGFMGER